MANTVIIRWQLESGDAATALYDRVHPFMMEMIQSPDYPGLVAHVCSKAPDGLVVVDVWEDAATWQALVGDPRVREAFGEAGIPEPASVEILETHNTERGPAFDVL